jgi:hypothetical protein
MKMLTAISWFVNNVVVTSVEFASEVTYSTVLLECYYDAIRTHNFIFSEGLDRIFAVICTVINSEIYLN